MSIDKAKAKSIEIERTNASEIPTNVPFYMMTYKHPNLIQFEHSHVFFELGYLREGSIIHSVGGKSTYAEKGDYFIIDIGDVHSYKSIIKSDVIVMQNCLFLPTLISHSSNSSQSFKDMISSHPLNIDWSMLKEDPTSTIFHDETGEIGMILNILERENSGKQCHPQMLKGLISTILILTMQKIMRTYSNSTKEIINAILRYASEHYFENNILTSLSTEIHYSLPYLSSIFSKEMGISFKEHIQKIRIDEACKLLISSNHKINYISSFVGYKSETQFHKTFMKFTGTTPNEYRRTVRDRNNI